MVSDSTPCDIVPAMRGSIAWTGALAPAVLAAALASSPAPAAKPALPFIEDDYPRALAEARTKKLPIFVEAWAPW
jgi:hypothetical protein